MTMRHISFEEAESVAGAACANLTLSIGFTGASMSGSLGDWSDCLRIGSNFIADKYGALEGYLRTGIPYGEPHVG
jgi:hypothetical protein